MACSKNGSLTVRPKYLKTTPRDFGCNVDKTIVRDPTSPDIEIQDGDLKTGN